MWLCLNDAFFSIVTDRHNPSRLLVRARQVGDMRAVFPQAAVEVGTGSDYLFRAYIDRQQVAAVIALTVEDIHYDNFKNSVRDGARRRAYSQFWETMYNFRKTTWTTNSAARKSPDPVQRQGSAVIIMATARDHATIVVAPLAILFPDAQPIGVTNVGAAMALGLPSSATPHPPSPSSTCACPNCSRRPRPSWYEGQHQGIEGHALRLGAPGQLGWIDLGTRATNLPVASPPPLGAGTAKPSAARAAMVAASASRPLAMASSTVSPSAMHSEVG